MKIECPYCDQEFNETHYDQGPNERYEAECPNCSKVCAYEIEYEIIAHAYKAPCLNGGDHDWTIGECYPEFMKNRQCPCGEFEYIYSEDERRAKAADYLRNQ